MKQGLLWLALSMLWGCAPKDEVSVPPPDSEPELEIEFLPSHVTSCAPISLEIRLRAGTAGLPENSSIMVGFPHHYYAIRCPGPRWLKAARVPTKEELPPSEAHGALDVSIHDDQFAGWYLQYELNRGLEPGGSALLTLPKRSAPANSSGDFEPVMLLRTGPGRPWQKLDSKAGIKIQARPPSHLRVTAPTVLAPGAALEVELCLLDALGNPSGELPETVTTGQGTAKSVLRSSHAACGTVSLPGFAEPGIHEVELHAAVGTTRFQARSAPILVEATPYQLVWADLHGHSMLSDGHGSPDAYYRYARDVAHLDAAALSDHDWQSEAHEIRQGLAAAETHNDAGRFVTIPALETNIIGHEVAYFFAPDRLAEQKIGVAEAPAPPMINGKPASDYFDPAVLAELQPDSGHALTIWQERLLSLPAATPVPRARKLLERYGNKDLLVASHSTLAPGMGSAFPLKNEPPAYQLIEIYSAHGSSECRGCERAPDTGTGEPTGSVREALEHHAPLGFIAAGDSHDGKPGRSNWGAHRGGLTGLWVNELSRQGLLEAMNSRRVFATTGQRSLIQFQAQGMPMGSALTVDAGPLTLRLRVLGSRPIQEIQIIRNGALWKKLDGNKPGVWQQAQDNNPSTARYYYLKAIFSDGAIAWSSPLFTQATVYP